MITRGKILTGLLALSLSVAACGSDSPESSANTGTDGGGSLDEPVAITVGTSPTLSNAALYYADSAGLFEDRNLDVTIEPIQSGAAAVPLLLNGQLTFTASDPGAALIARSQDVPLTIVATGNVSAPDAETDSTAILVRDDGSVEDVADLEGLTFGVNALNSVAHLTSRKTIDDMGGDSSAVNFVELPLPQSVDSVVNSQVDAVAVNEPFATQGTAAGLRILANPFSQAIPGVPQLVYLGSDEFTQENPEVAQAFAEAITEANAYLADNPEEIREIGRTSTQTPPEVLEQIVLPTFVAEPVTTERLEPLMDLMLEYEALAEPVDLETAVFAP